MELQISTNQQEWDNWLKQSGQYVSFTQSWEWGSIMETEGKKVERLMIRLGDQIVAQAQVIYSKIGTWQYVFCPKGPILFETESQDQKLKIYEVLNSFLQEKNCLFFRIEPNETPSLNHVLSIKKTIDINPRATTIVDLTKPEEELLSSMHQKTRYNIRLAEKKNLEIDKTKDLEGFLKLMKATGERDKFKLHDEKHYEHILYSPLTEQISIKLDGASIAVGIFVGFGDTFTYLYGASDYAYRNYMAPYLVQWHGMQLGKELGYTKYDFFGIAPTVIDQHGEFQYDQKHQYAGVTRFKLGFGGEIKVDPGTFDVILKSTSYKFYQLFRKIRRLV